MKNCTLLIYGYLKGKMRVTAHSLANLHWAAQVFHRQETGTQSNILFMQSMLFNELLTLGLFDLGQFGGRERR